MFHVKRPLVQENETRNPRTSTLGHGLGHGAGICPVDPMMLMIAPALPPGWLTGMGFPGVGPGVGIGPLV